LDGFVQADGQPAVDETIAFVEDTSIDLANNSVSSLPTIQATRRRKSGGGLRSMLGVVVGGLLAVPIAGVLLWGMGRYLGRGPFAESYGGSQNRVAFQPLEIREDREPVVNRQTPTETTSAASQASSDEPGFELPTADPPPTDAPLTETSTTADPSAENIDIRQQEPVEPSTSGVPDVELDLQPESKELVDTVDRALQMIDALQKYEVDQKKRVQWLVTAYQTIASAGALAESNGPAIQDLAQAIKNSKILDDLDKAGSDWMQFDTRSNDGALIIGVADGRSLTLGSGKTVKLSGDVSVPGSGRVMVMGQILDPQTVKVIVVEPLPE
jgi:hypothetical protein